MSDFTVTITDTASLAGITWARGRYNTAHPDAQIGTDAGYVQFVMENAAASYAVQQAQPPDDSP